MSPACNHHHHKPDFFSPAWLQKSQQGSRKTAQSEKLEPAPESGNIPEQKPDAPFPVPDSDFQLNGPDGKESVSQETDSISEEIDSSFGKANAGEFPGTRNPDPGL